jgi:Tol biopolymer transport system component
MAATSFRLLSSLRRLVFAVGLGLLAVATATPASAQYFGRAKVNYQHFDFRILHTKHFDIYFYPAESLAANDGGRMAERWYERHSNTLAHAFERKPIIFYADQPDFQQTNLANGDLTEATGGFTEGSRDRVVLPFTGVYFDNDHVIGHELVHVFQYDIAQTTLAGGLARVEQLPLWLIEGMAEYLSLGRVSPLTAMWMRDALQRNRVPTIKQLTNDPNFFPYRYGQAFWAFVGGTWGDKAVGDVYTAALRYGWEPALIRVLGVTSDSLSRLWINSIREEYSPIVQGRTPSSQVGHPLLTQGKKTGTFNLSPVLSPDGKYVAFFSERGLFSVDLYLADAHTGKVIRQLASPAANSHFDAISFIYSSGSFSPDGKQFAFVSYASGDNELAIFDVASGHFKKQLHLKRVPAMTTLDWSPDGKHIAIAGQHGGIGDLFVVDLTNGSVEQMTDDRYAEMQPSWSPDGKTIAFATDRGPKTNLDSLTHGPMQIALMDVATKDIRLLHLFDNGKHINPQFTPDGKELYFVSDQDGVPDIYRVNLETNAISRVTRISTGVSGITELSPAISVGRTDGRVLATVFENQGYTVYSLDSTQALGAPLAAADSLGVVPEAGNLPPINSVKNSLVLAYLKEPSVGLPTGEDFHVGPYHTSLFVEAIGTPSVGVATGQFGTVVGGSTAVYFGDMLGNQQIGVGIAASGTLQDIGGQVSYVNQSHRWNWGMGYTHAPYLTGFTAAGQGDYTLPDGTVVPNAIVYQQIIQRVKIDQAQLGTQYPFTPTYRFELSGGFTHYSYSNQVESIVYDQSGNFVGDIKTNPPAPPGISLFQASTAFVHDNSYFGFTSPIAGTRWRLEAAPAFGSLNFWTFTADYRRYFFPRPFTLAYRGLFFGRYGKDAESNQLSLLYVGSPALVRGYDSNSFGVVECGGLLPGINPCSTTSRLVGSKVGVMNLELRIPLFGTDALGVFRTKFLPVEVAPFLDAGAAWTSTDPVVWKISSSSTERVPVFSAGVTTRFNLLGYLVFEVYAAHPFQRNDKSWVWGFQLLPGW